MSGLNSYRSRGFARRDDASSKDNGVDRAFEVQLVDEILGDSYPRPSSSKGTSKSKNMQPQTNDVVAAMAARLSRLEASHRRLKHEAIEKDQRLLELENENAELKRLFTNAIPPAESANMESEYRRLRQQVAEMEGFLNDYGLIWVGNSPVDSAEQMLSTSSSKQEGVPVDESKEEEEDCFTEFGALIARIRELNTAAGEGTTKVVPDKSGRSIHKLQVREGIPFTLFKDGFMLYRGPFREFTDPHSQSFITDIMEGYFPYEFKNDHPDGVILKVIDRRTEKYKDKFRPFAGGGTSVNANVAKVRGLSSIGNPHMQLSTKQFLRNLPEAVVRDGQVLNIRSEVGAMVGDNGDAKAKRDVILIETPALNNCREALAIDDSDVAKHSIATVSDIATLQIRSDDGTQTLVLKLHYADTVGDIRKYIDPYRLSERQYELRTSFPNKAYSDDTVTLQQAGLVPNATLFMRLVADNSNSS